LDPTRLIGPLASATALHTFEHAIAESQRQGGKVIFGGGRLVGGKGGREVGGFWAEPCVVDWGEGGGGEVVGEETFAPICHVMRVGSLEEAIRENNKVCLICFQPLDWIDAGELMIGMWKSRSDKG
jgi:aldehyde dehydrogenase (NAD+)